jgi:hypothetical protein
MDIFRVAQVNASTQMQQSQVAQAAQVLVLKKGHGHQATGALALLTGPAVGHEWQHGHSGQYEGVGCLPVNAGGVDDQCPLPNKPVS